MLSMQQTSASSLTVLSGVGAADGGHGGSPRHNELVRVALVVGGLGLGEDHVVHVKPGMRTEVSTGQGKVQVLVLGSGVRGN